MRNLSLLFLFLLPASVFGQDKVLFTNGVEKHASILYQDNKWIRYGIKPKRKINQDKLSQIENSFKEKQDLNEKKYTDLLANYKKNAEEKREQKIADIKLKYSDTKIQAEKIKTVNSAIDAAINAKETSFPVNKNISSQLIKKKEIIALGNVQYKTLKKVLKDNVFSITRSGNKEEIIYSPDTLGFLVNDVVEPELDLSVEEMRRYIYGRQDGMKVKKTGILLTSAGISTVGSGLGAFFGPIAPATYIIVLGSTKQKPKAELVSHPEYIEDENYLEGFKKSARKRKVIAAAEGGLIGLAIGIPIYWAAFRGF